MEEIINSILRAEERAQSIIGEAEARAARFDEDMKLELSLIDAKYEEDAAQRIAEIKAAEDQAAEESLMRLQREYEASLASLGKLYAENKTQWLEHMFHSITDPAVI